MVPNNQKGFLQKKRDCVEIRLVESGMGWDVAGTAPLWGGYHRYWLLVLELFPPCIRLHGFGNIFIVAGIGPHFIQYIEPSVP